MHIATEKIKSRIAHNLKAPVTEKERTQHRYQHATPITTACAWREIFDCGTAPPIRLCTYPADIRVARSTRTETAFIYVYLA